MTQEISISYNGTSLDTSTASLERYVERAPVFDPIGFEDIDNQFPGHGLALATRVPMPRKFSFRLVSKIKDQSAILDILRHAKKETQDLASILDASLGDVKVEFDTYDEADSAYSRFLWGCVDSTPVWNWSERGEQDGVRNSGVIKNNIVCTARYPWFVGGSAAYDQTKTNGSSHTVPNAGDLWTGFRIEVVTPAGDWDYKGIRIENDADSDDGINFSWPDKTMTDGDVIEYWYPNAAIGGPRGVGGYRSDPDYGYLRGVAAITAGGFMKIPVGGGDYTITATDGSTGTCSFKLTVYERFYSL